MDTDLVTRAQRGDKEAYAILAAGFADRHLAVARRILRDLDLAEDATQQALLTDLARPSPTPRPGPLRSLVVSAPRARLLCRGPEATSLGTEHSPPAG